MRKTPPSPDTATSWQTLPWKDILIFASPSILLALMLVTAALARAEAFLSTDSLATARNSHTATLLANARVTITRQ